MPESGMNYAPKGKPSPVVKPGEFIFAAIGLDHGHIGGMCNGLVEAGASLKLVYDPDTDKAEKLAANFPGAKVACSEEEVFQDKEIALVASAAIPCDRAPLGIRAMNAGKDYFVDKAPLTTLAQLEEARATVAKTGRKFAVYYSERLHSEVGMFAGQLIADGAIGRVVQTMGTGPHRANMPSRPGWFLQREQNGGILCDIGSHQCEQFLFYTGATDAQVLSAQVENYNFPEHPGVDDFGDCVLKGNNGASGYFRVDWLTPDGLSTWGDGRTFILGTKGYIELRKYCDVGRDPRGEHLFLVNNDSEQYIDVNGKVGFPYFGELVLDCLNRTEKAMTQEHAFKAAELCVTAQVMAEKVRGIVR